MPPLSPAAQAEAEEKKKKALQEILKSPASSHLIKDNGLSEEVIRDNVWTVNRWLNEIAPCSGCKSLTFCGQKVKGYVPDLVYDGIVKKNLVPCRYMKEKLKAESHLGRILINQMPESLYTVSFASIDVNAKENDAAYCKVLDEVWTAYDNNQGIFLYGGMGTGKTYLAACAVNEAARKGRSCAFVVWPAFVQKLQTEVKSGEYRDAVSLLGYVPFLVIDDIGAEKVTEWNRDEILFTILNERCENGRCTWFTSNDDYRRLEDHFALAGDKREELKAKRIVERIMSMTEPEALTGKDRRKAVD